MDSKELHCDISAVKTRLMEYRERERDIDNQLERIDNLSEKMVSLQSPELSGMPHAQFSSHDRIGKMIARKDEIEHEVKDLMDIQESERRWIEGIITHIKADERACIQMRYIDMESWSKVSMLLYGNKDDYEERKDSYLRRTTNVHGRALVQMAEWIEGHK